MWDRIFRLLSFVLNVTWQRCWSWSNSFDLRYPKRLKVKGKYWIYNKEHSNSRSRFRKGRGLRNSKINEMHHSNAAMLNCELTRRQMLTEGSKDDPCVQRFIQGSVWKVRHAVLWDFWNLLERRADDRLGLIFCWLPAAYFGWLALKPSGLFWLHSASSQAIISGWKPTKN